MRSTFRGICKLSKFDACESARARVCVYIFMLEYESFNERITINFQVDRVEKDQIIFINSKYKNTE